MAVISDAVKNSEKTVIPYVTAGVPDLETTGEIIRALADAGAPVVEVGLPFSDPVADGPVLQEAAQRAISGGFTLEGFYAALERWSACVPLVVMGYMNPLERHGLSRSLARLADCGVRGLIVADLPADASTFQARCTEVGLDLVRLVAPTTPDARLAEVVNECGGFVYAVADKGVTGERESVPAGLQAQVARIREHTELPVCVGFGVSSAAQVREILTFADGAIVGSVLMRAVLGADDPVRAARKTYEALLE